MPAEEIRKAELSDLYIVGSLILESYGDYFYVLFGNVAKILVSRLYKEPGNLFSKENAYVHEKDNKPVGIVVLYEGKKIKRLALKTFFLLIGFLGLPFLRYVIHHRKVILKPHIKRDEMCLAYISISKEFRGMGYGSRLLDFVEKLAIERNYKKIVVDLPADNLTALKLYEKRKYVKESSFRVLAKGKKYEFVTLKKLLKEVK